MDSISLLREIVAKGGVIGLAGKMYLSDKEKAHRYILECSQQCDAKATQELWGEKLISKIKQYVEENS